MDMDTGQTILTRGLPKTGQVTVHIAGDDGTHQAGWWKGKTVANNKTRFIVKTLDGDDVVIDLATGLMWPKNVSGAGGNSGAAGLWATQIAYANGLTFASFSDWRMPNVFEMFTITKLSGGFGCWYDVFTNTLSAPYWTSTKALEGSAYRYVVTMTDGLVIIEEAATAERRLLCCRGGL